MGTSEAPLHQGRDTRPHSGNSERHHPEQRIITGRDAGRVKIQTNPAKARDCAEYPQIRRTKTPHLAGSFREDPGQGQASRREIFIQRMQQNGNRVQAQGDDGELVGAAWVLVRAFAMEPQTPDFPVTNCECGDHGYRRIRGITERAEQAGQVNMQVPEGPFEGQSMRQHRHGESRT